MSEVLATVKCPHCGAVITVWKIPPMSGASSGQVMALAGESSAAREEVLNAKEGKDE